MDSLCKGIPIKNVPAPAWIPDPALQAETNLGQLMSALYIETYQELHRWSVQNFQEFWERSINRVGIQFTQPYEQLCDLSQGIENPTWLKGAQFNIVDSCFQGDPERVAIVANEGDKLSFISLSRLERYVNRFARGLLQEGLKPGNRIAMAMPMTWQSVAAYLGVIKAGGVVVSIADSFSVEEIDTRLEITRPEAVVTQDYVVCGGKIHELYKKILRTRARKVIVVPAFKESRSPIRTGDTTWEEILSDDDQFESVVCNSDTISNILFSSGTTGTPKAIPWTHATPIKCAVDGHWHHDIQEGDRFAWPSNLGWMMGPWLIYATLINRATMALYSDTPRDEKFGRFVQDAELTHLGLVPSLVKIWRASGCMEDLDWKKLRLFSSTGECSNPDEMLYLMKLADSRPVIEYCGGTEIGGGYITGTVIQLNSPATFSTPAMGLDFDILDEEGNLATNGEVFLKNPSIGLSTSLLKRSHHEEYYEGTPAAYYRRHGDQIEALGNGYYRAHGRVDDTMNLGGIKVSCDEIERACSGIEEISEVAAIEVSSIGGGPSELILYVVPSRGIVPRKSELLDKTQWAIKQNLNPLFKVADIFILSSLPRTASNKVMRRELRQLYKEQETVKI